MKLLKINFIYILLLFSFLLGIYQLNNLPSLNPDEAALGYNAYSLIQTGKDEHGNVWPLHFKSFGDYKPGGYVYLLIPFIKVFGLTPFITRLPNLLLSILQIYILYKLILLLSKSYRLSLCCSIVLSLTPWHIHFSRGAWESSTALTFILTGIYFFYIYKVKHTVSSLYFSSFFFSSSLYFYHSARIITPLILIFLFFANKIDIVYNFKKILLPLTLGIIITLPIFLSFLNSGGSTRYNSVGITSDLGPLSRAEELLNQHGNTQILNRIIHNRRVLYFLSWMQKYFSHFDLNFLFLNGDEVPRSKSPEIGQLFVIELPLFILGLIFLSKSSQTNDLFLLTLYFLLISPMAASLTFQAPSALRALPMVLPMCIFIGSGINFTLILTNKYFPHNFFLFLILYLYSFFYFFDAYFIHSPIRYSFAWNQGFSEIVSFVESSKANFKNIYITDKYDQPYILYLFFTRYPPSKIQSQIKLTQPDKFGFSTVQKIDNITFKIPDLIPTNSLVIDYSDFISTGESFKIYTK